jgi:RNA polymerase sigma-70 factor (ECF subfamily)
LVPSDFSEDLVQCIPHLRAFARALTGSRDAADDLVQDTIVRALNAADQFTPGTNLKAWLFKILRNQHINIVRRGRHLVEYVEDISSVSASVPASQDAGLEFEDFARSFMQLTEDQREVLLLVGASGFSYEEASLVCDCAVGTIKSRLSRARRELASHLRRSPEDGGAKETDREGAARTAKAVRTWLKNADGLHRQALVKLAADPELRQRVLSRVA